MHMRAHITLKHSESPMNTNTTFVPLHVYVIGQSVRANSQ